jgi:Fe-S oxidoreductase
VNTLLQAPLLARCGKALAGVAEERQAPVFAQQSFVQWWRQRNAAQPDPADPKTVVLWPDTFSTYFHPSIAISAVRVLEDAGFKVAVPTEPVCCGLTWISTGQLGIAERVLRRTVDTLAPYMREGLPLVGLEPSCTAVFRSDLGELFGHDQDADRLARQTVTLSELLIDKAPGFRPRLPGAPVEAIVQRHCHQHAILGADADAKVMEFLGLDGSDLDSGCCGLAGNFGMTPAHREVSLGCAEQALLPAVRSASRRTVVLADGFSCRTQIADARVGREAVHLAEVLNAAVHGVQLKELPERQLVRRSGHALR